MKIMFYINTLAGGGAQRVMANLANLFSDAGDEVIFVTSFPAENEYALDAAVDRRNLSQGRIGSGFKRNAAYILGLRKLVKEEKPDILVGFMRQPNIRAILAGLGQKTKTVISVRNDPKVEYRGALGSFLGKKLLPLADGCVFQTEEAKLWFPKKLQDKSSVIPNAVKPDFFAVEHKRIPGRVITCGRLEEQKNHKLLIQAFTDAVRDLPEAELLIYGEGKLRPELMKLIEDKGMIDRIKLMGNTPDVPGVLASADCFVLSSDYEGMPNALMEAMAVGVPCISTDCPCGGPKMLIENEKSGMLVSVGDKEALASAIRQVLTDREYAHALGDGARNAAENYKPERIFAQWKQYFENC